MWKSCLRVILWEASGKSKLSVTLLSIYYFLLSPSLLTLLFYPSVCLSLCLSVSLLLSLLFLFSYSFSFLGEACHVMYNNTHYCLSLPLCPSLFLPFFIFLSISLSLTSNGVAVKWKRYLLRKPVICRLLCNTHLVLLKWASAISILFSVMIFLSLSLFLHLSLCLSSLVSPFLFPFLSLCLSLNLFFLYFFLELTIWECLTV